MLEKHTSKPQIHNHICITIDTIMAANPNIQFPGEDEDDENDNTSEDSSMDSFEEELYNRTNNDYTQGKSKMGMHLRTVFSNVLI